MRQKKEVQNESDIVRMWDDIARHSHDVIAKIDSDFKIAYISPSLERYFAGSRFDCIGHKTASLLMPVAVNELVNDSLKRVFATGVEEYLHFSFVAKGETRFFETTFHPDYNDAGLLDHVVAIAKDVTSEARIRQIKDRSYAQKVLLAEFSKDCMNATPKNYAAIIDKTLMQVGAYLRVDRVYVFQYNFEHGFASNTHEWVAKGISPEKDNLQSLPLVMIPDWVERHTRGEQLIVKDVKKLKAGSYTRKTLESQQVKSLASFPLIVDRSCIGFVGLDSVKQRRIFEKDEIDALTLLANLLSNLMSKVKADEAIIAQNALITAYMENAFTALYIFRNGAFEYVNSTFCKITGYSEKEILSPKFDYSKLFYSAKNEAKKAIEERMNGNLENKSYKLRIRTKEGILKLVHINTAALFDSKGLYSVGVAMDISNSEKVAATIQRINKELEIKNEELKEFAYMASHNLRSPIANILGLVDHFAQSLGDDPVHKDYVNGIKDSTLALQKSLNDMHRVMEVKGEENADIEPIDLKDTTRRISRMLANQIDESNIKITTDFKINEFSYVKYHIENLFINLISNAVRYRSETGEPTLHIAAKKSGQNLKISFSDNGLGIDLKRHGHHIFGIYKRFHDHPDSRGLGLYLVRSQLEKRGGKIEVESTLGKGTTFHITLKV